MLESMIGPDTRNKMLGTSVALVVAIMSFVGAVLILVTSVSPLWHVHLWPAVGMLLLGGSTLAIKGKTPRLVLSLLVIPIGLWVMLNVIGGWIVPSAPEFGDVISGDAGTPEMMAPILLMLAGLGGLVGALGGLVGVFGALKY